MNFSENLRNIRKERNLSQEQLAELLSVSRQAVSKWEQGDGYPETEKLVSIAQKLDVSLDALLLNKQPEPEIADVPQSNTVFSSNRKIFVQSFDGKTMAAYYKFSVQDNLLSKKIKDEPKCCLAGTDTTSFWGDNLVTLGWYATHEDATRELNDIYTAIQNGETTYQLKYNAKVKVKAFGIKLL
ncbi:MAG: helix-turn-helix domain-containing protein [Oscillospiraceae bacterium]|nr:helix-turn-helix domain-containing protein [Oscillospiraceae bacterium]